MPPFSTPSETKALLATVEQTLAAHHMTAPGDRVLVGVSGGPDSMALLHLLSRLAPDLNIRIGVAHLNHGLRGASADKDAEVVRQAVQALHYPFHIGRSRVLKVKEKLGLSLEEAARRVRYAFFKKTMSDTGYNKLALGHQSNDNAEQMLMALLRGTGPRGLSGIAPVRQEYIIRPLINARRSQIDTFVAQEGITCVLDESNNDLRFVRNRIRRHLLPLIASDYNPRIQANLNQLADVMRTEEDWIDGMTTGEYDKTVLRRVSGAITLSAETVSQAHPALARRLVRKALADLTGSLRRITFFHVQSVLHLLTDGCGVKVKELHLPGGIRARRADDRLMLLMADSCCRSPVEPSVERTPAPATEISTPFPATVEITTMGIGLRMSTCRPDQLPRWADVDRNQAHLDLDRIALPLTLRPVIPGDRFTPLGTNGSQKLKKFFIDHRIHRQARAIASVLMDKQRIIWLVGHRIDDHVKVTTATSQVLRVEFFLLDTR
ncbi:tRNA lysidine(34) synthetase TilS [Desulfosarcina sp.]|uniref:tRNA lysidine(34) synthetase TilS n=1 Tax=Desulfosarcina sp. TaxID=2027861 RepID=UPI0029B5565E|nr:tRNA lysidine(34) synthetase TilS [Desulfosarcina sp.]MDX2453617.1 tRNA lysidine(34) synthetase TilS [Desulfosarcina sp.]MDX2491324.1 tRNA lysidine(34) synthetase TilS [Desulfosarcina sp.]